MKTPKRILVIRLSALGDIALSVPVIHYLVKQNADLEVYVLSMPFTKTLFKEIPNCHFLDLNVKKEFKGFIGLYHLYQLLKKYELDAVADLHNVLRSNTLKLFFKLFSGTKVKWFSLNKNRKSKDQLTRKKNKQLRPLTNVTEAYADVFRRMGFQLFIPHQRKDLLAISPAGDNHSIGIAPFAKHAQKMFPLDKMKKVALELSERGYKIYLFGSPAEAPILESWEENLNILSLAGKYKLQEELQVMKGLTLMITMDSANMHLASLVGTRVFSVWGATHPYLGFLGYGQSNRDVFQHNNLGCRPCSVYGNKKCWRGDFACMNNLDEKKLLNKCLDAIQVN